MTKDNFVYYIQGVLSVAIPTPELKKKFNSKDIVKCIARNMNIILGEKILIAKYSTGEYSFLDYYTKLFVNIPLQTDNATNQLCAEIPCIIADLPDNMAIRNIVPYITQCDKPYIDETQPFIYQTVGDASIFSHLDVDKTMRFKEYTIRFDKPFFKNVPSNITAVAMNLVVSFESLNGKEDVKDPFIKYDEHGNPQGDLVDRVL